MDSIFCHAKPGDVVYDIPEPNENRLPRKFWVHLGHNKTTIVTDVDGKEHVYNPEHYRSCLSEALQHAISNIWAKIQEDLQRYYETIDCHKTGKYPSQVQEIEKGN